MTGNRRLVDEGLLKTSHLVQKKSLHQSSSLEKLLVSRTEEHKQTNTYGWIHTCVI